MFDSVRFVVFAFDPRGFFLQVEEAIYTWMLSLFL